MPHSFRNSTAVVTAMVVLVFSVVGCARNSGSSAPSSSAPGNKQSPATVAGAQMSDALDAPAGAPASTPDLSENATSAQITIKRLSLSGSSSDVLDPNPVGTAAPQSGVMILSFCAPRIDPTTVGKLAGSAYPIVLTDGSQALLHRDQNYHFGDGSTSNKTTPFALFTCNSINHAVIVPSDSMNLDAAPLVDVKHLRKGDVTIEAINPNPKGTGTVEPGRLTLIGCGPRITDGTLQASTQGSFPILISEGSQIYIKRDLTYPYKDGAGPVNPQPGVLITCN